MVPNFFKTLLNFAVLSLAKTQLCGTANIKIAAIRADNYILGC